MATKTKHGIPSVESIQEDSEDESMDDRGAKHDDSPREAPHRQHRQSSSAMVAPVKAVPGKERRRKHRSGGRKHHSRREEMDINVKYASGLSIGDSERPSIRHRRSLSNRSTSSTSSSSDEDDEPTEDHRAVLQARAKLTSPSVLSTNTSLTTTTNKSSGSSGSNSTVTQASVTKRSLGKRPELPEAPMSPAVPDAPDVFAFLDNGSTVSLANDDDGDQEEETTVTSPWRFSQDHQFNPSLPANISADQANSSSSTSSSLHGSDHLSEPSAESADNDTDRSTSPERSVHDQSDHSEQEEEAGADPASDKIASQIAAAQQRQSQYTGATPQNFGTPNMARGPAVYPYVPPSSSALSPRSSQPVMQRTLPRAEKLPVTGYELLATRLSHASSNPEDGEKIKPMYRKFEALNHRLLLHLQDEISELEERLHRLDHADSQSRKAVGGAVIPASRRAAQAAGGELQWHKTDVLGRIGFKLAQYNQALAAFNATQALQPPDPADVSHYREYLEKDHPIVEVEARFLDPTDDLVSVCSEKIPRYASSFCPETQTSESISVAFEQFSSPPDFEQAGLSSLAAAIAVAVLVPILTFPVIPGFIGRMAVVGLVAGFVVFALTQSNVIGRHSFGREGLVCAGIYGGVMIIVAGIV